jgi:hypothetical protein
MNANVLGEEDPKGFFCSGIFQKCESQWTSELYTTYTVIPAKHSILPMTSSRASSSSIMLQGAITKQLCGSLNGSLSVPGTYMGQR